MNSPGFFAQIEEPFAQMEESSLEVLTTGDFLCMMKIRLNNDLIVAIISNSERSFSK